MDVKLPDGTIVKDVPEGTTKAQLLEKVARMRSLGREGNVVKAPRTQFVPSGEKAENPLLTGQGVLQGPGLIEAGQGVMDLARGAQQLLTFGKSNEDVTRKGTQEREQFEKDWNDADGGVQLGRMGSKMALTAPLMALPMGNRLLGQMGWGAGTGAAAAGLEFVPEGGSRAGNVAAGAGVGAVMPGAVAGVSKLAKMGYHGIVEPMLASGREAIKGRAYLEAAGDKADDIISRLLANRQLVPGSKPTAGEAASPAGRAEFSALQESAAKANPSAYFAREEGNNAARVASLREWAGTPAKRAAAVANRERVTAPLYERGAQESVSGVRGTFANILEHPSTRAAVARAEKLIEEETGRKVDLASKLQWRGGEGIESFKLTGDEAQKIKLAFDDLITYHPKSAADANDLKALQATRGRFIELMESEFPSLGRARALYKHKSAPINQMDVGEALVEKLTPALREEGKPRAGVFAGAVRDSASTIKKATGSPRFTSLEDVLTGPQLQSVHGVTDDLARADRHMALARKGAGSAGAMDLATANLQREVGGKLPNMLERGVMITNAIINRLEGRVNKQLAAEMAVEMLDPPKVGKALQGAQARQTRNDALVKAILEAQRAGTITAVNQGTQGD